MGGCRCQKASLLLDFVLQQSHLCLSLFSRQPKYSHPASREHKRAFSQVETKGTVGKPFDCSLQSLSHVRLFATAWTAACQASLSVTNSRSLHKLMSITQVMPSNHLILCHPLLFLPSIFPSIGVFSNELVLCMRWPKYWSFSFNINPSNEYSGLISFRIDCFDLLAVQGTLKSLLQHQSLKAKKFFLSCKCKRGKLQTSYFIHFCVLGKLGDQMGSGAELGACEKASVDF